MTNVPAPPHVAPHVAPQADHGDVRLTTLQRIANLRAWLFLAALIIGFELWSRLDFGGSFIMNPYNIQSIAIFAVVPLIIATGIELPVRWA